ncbi:MAG TPA: PEGA domain-containing protein [Acidobacteriota bacterium]|nr:PEGA domain-containing protein [Acidobacteriota bacterium]
MRKPFTFFAALAVALTLTGVAQAQNHNKRHLKKPAQRGYFFMPPRNYFFLYPRYYPPFRIDSGAYRGRYYSPYGRSYSRGLHSRPHAARYYDDSYYDYYDDYYEDDSYYPGPGQGIYTIYTQSPLRTEIVHANSSNIIFRVSPSTALVYIDGKLIGSAGDFSTRRDRYMVLEGEHELRIEYPGHQTFETVMEVIPNKTINLDIELQPLP